MSNIVLITQTVTIKNSDLHIYDIAVLKPS